MADSSPISGSINPQTFPFLLTDLHRNGATGSLKVDGPTYQKALYFRSGRVLFGSSNDPRDQLGAILIENNRITPEQLEDVNAKVGPGRPLAKVLSESGLVSQQELSEAAQIKVERILWDIITYTGGSFEFEDGVLPKGAVDLKLSTERLILAAVRRVTDRSFVLRHLGSLEIVLRPTPELTSRLHEVQSDAGGLAEQIDGERTLKEAAALTRLDEFDAAKIACGLLILALVERTEAGPASVEADEHMPFVIPDRADASEVDLAQTARDSISDQGESGDSPFFVPEGFSPPPPAPLEIETSPEPELEIPATVILPPQAEPEMFAPSAPPPRVSRPASSPNLPLIHPPPRNAAPEPPAWTPPLEPEPAPSLEDERPTVSVPPSKEDLAALDALLNPRMAASMEPSSRAESWEPKFTSLTGGGRRPVPGGGVKPAILILALLVVLAGGGAAFYFLYWLPSQTPPKSAERATPAPPARAAAPTVAAASPSSAPATPAATLAPTAAVTAARTAVATATRTAAPPVPTTAPTRAAAAAGSGGSGLGEARVELHRGRFDVAAEMFASHLRKRAGGFTVQILVACSDDTIKKASDAVRQDELYIVPVVLKGRSCYRVAWGIYDSEARANGALRSLPDYFRQNGATPRVVSMATVLP